jgi:hypothetical protein
MGKRREPRKEIQAEVRIFGSDVLISLGTKSSGERAPERVCSRAIGLLAETEIQHWRCVRLSSDRLERR